MNDWNGNGQYDLQDRYLEYNMINKSKSRASSNWWIFLLFAIICNLCPAIGLIIFLIILITRK